MIIAVTGHQHPKIKDEKALDTLFQRTFHEVTPELVIVGMACGTDLIAGIAAVKTSFPVTAVIPWKGHQKSKYITDCKACVENYKFMMGFAREIVVLDDSEDYPGPQSFHARNHYMVDNATHVLAYYDGKSGGGTAATVKYADGKGVLVRNLYGKN